MRRAARLTQAMLAIKADISCVYVNKLERGHAVPSISVLFRLAEALKADASNLITLQVASVGYHEPVPSPYLSLFQESADAQTRRLVFEIDPEVDLPDFFGSLRY